MKKIAMIPARFAASRFPGKLMQMLGSKTVILRTYEAAVNTGLFNEVYIVTDSDVIAEEIKKHGGNVIMSKANHETGSDRIAEAVEQMDADIVVNVQGDEPFINKESLAKVLAVFDEDEDEKIDLASIMLNITEPDDISNPNNVKVIVDAENFAMYFSRSPIPFYRDKTINVKYYKHIGIYAFRKQALLDFTTMPMLMNEASEKIEAIRYLEYGKKIKMVETNEVGIGIDTPEDLEKAKKLLNE
ncbi:MAG: 3-deoxy-manno-octulosonate cytidylyltransferase [Ichthyobacteriaceae bacterium]|nr:3-deoxy-manno-octulosonate cytidylyltransferase [Ichthyobacteriaceae bacterium]